MTGVARSPQLPELPTMIESGLTGFEANGWNGLVAPAGTPEVLIEKLSAEVTRAMKDPAVAQKIADTGWELVSYGATPEQFAKFIGNKALHHGLFLGVELVARAHGVLKGAVHYLLSGAKLHNFVNRE